MTFSFPFCFLVSCLLVGLACSPSLEQQPVTAQPSTLFIKDSVPPDYTPLIALVDSLLQHQHPTNFMQYLDKDCPFITLDTAYRTRIIDFFEPLKGLGDITGNQQLDSVYVLPDFSCVSESEAYYFTDTSLPRLHGDSECCHPSNIFALGDINQDGVQELAQFYSSCVSRYKSIKYWTLDQGQWRMFGRSTFCLNGQYDVYEDFEQLYRIPQAGVLEVLSINDEDVEGKLDTTWMKFKFP